MQSNAERTMKPFNEQGSTCISLQRHTISLVRILEVTTWS